MCRTEEIELEGKLYSFPAWEEYQMFDSDDLWSEHAYSECLISQSSTQCDFDGLRACVQSDVTEMSRRSDTCTNFHVAKKNARTDSILVCSSLWNGSGQIFRLDWGVF